MYKKIEVKDVRQLTLNGVKTHSPFVKILDEKAMLTLIRTRPELKGVYIVNSDGKKVALTVNNYNIPLQEIFGVESTIKAINENPIPVKAVKETKTDSVIEDTEKSIDVVDDIVDETVDDTIENSVEDIVNETIDAPIETNENIIKEATIDDIEKDPIANAMNYVNSKKNKKNRNR